MRRIILLFTSLGMALIVVMVTLKELRPDAYYSIVATFGVGSGAGESQEERQRIKSIQLLPISDEKKTILINRTIFEGASPVMVKLAIGEPLKTGEGQEGNNGVSQFWVYHFEGENRPTVFLFRQDRLVKAYKTSAHILDAAMTNESLQQIPPTQ